MYVPRRQKCVALKKTNKNNKNNKIVKISPLKTLTQVLIFYTHNSLSLEPLCCTCEHVKFIYIYTLFLYIFYRAVTRGVHYECTIH